MRVEIGRKMASFHCDYFEPTDFDGAQHYIAWSTTLANTEHRTHYKIHGNAGIAYNYLIVTEIENHILKFMQY